MKKKLLIAFALALLLPWVTNAQTPTATLPYSTGFETGDDAGWELINGTVTNKWCVDTAVHRTGSRALYVSNDNGVSNSYTITSTGNCFAVRTFNFAGATNTYAISFDWKSGGESTYDYLRCFLVPNETTLTAGTLPSGVTATGTPTGWIDLGGKMNLSAGNWMNTTVEFTLPEAGNYKLVFMWRNDVSGGTQPAVAIDNVMLAEVACPTPTVTLAGLTATTATINIGSNATSSFLVSTDGEYWNTIFDTTTTLTELTPASAYTVYVRALCGGDDTSFAGTTNFTTLCMPIPTDSLPYVYGFEDATGSGASADYSVCWLRHQVGTTSNYPYPSTSYKHSGNYSLYYYSSGTIWSWSTLPQFEEPINNLQLSFWLYKSSANYGQIYVGVMSDPDDLSTFDTIAFVQPNAVSAWEYFEIPLMSYNGNGTYLTLLAASSALNYAYIDDVTIDLPPACPRPTDVAVTNVTANSADLTWHNNAASASEYTIEYGLHGFVQGNGAVVSANDTMASLSNLVMGMPYDAYVTAICGDDTSTVAFFTFNTGCSVITASDLPFSEDFEAYNSGATNPINSCWTKGTNSSTAYPYPYINAAVTGTRGLYFYGYRPSSATTAQIYSWAAMPPIDESLNMSDLMLRFNAKRYSTATNYYPSVLYVGIADSVTGFTSAANINAATTWMDTIDLSATPASSIHEIEVFFDQYTGEGRYVVFYAPVPELQGTASYAYNYFSVDDVDLTLSPTCFRPSALSIESVGSDEVTLSWVPDARTPNPSSWSVEYGPRGFTRGEGLIETASDTTITLTGLDANSWYDAYVSADCSGDLSDPRKITFVTNSIPAELPFVTSFENAEQNSGWVFYNETFLNHWMFGSDSSAVATGNMAMYITNDNIHNSYTTSSAISNVYAFRLLNLAEAGEYSCSFDWKCYGEGNYDYLRVFLVPNNIVINPGELNGISTTATPAGWINLGEYNNGVKLNLSSEWQTNFITIPISQDSVGLYKLVFFWHNDGSSGTQPPISVDNVDFRLLQCETPTNIVATNVSATSVDLSWEGNGVSYEIEYSTESNFSTSDTVTVNDVNTTINGLNEYSIYYFRIRSFCDDGDTSYWSNGIMVHTLVDCGPNTANILDTIGIASSSTYTYTFYAYSTYPRSITEAIYTAEELSNMGLQESNRINSISLHTGTTGGTIRQAKIYMKEVPLDEYGSTPASDTIDRSTMTLVKSGDLTFTASSWNEIVLDSVFNYSGNGNLVVLFAHDTLSTASVTFYYTSTTPYYRNAYSYVSSTSTTFGSVTRTYSRTDIAFNFCTDIPSCPRPSRLNVLSYTDTSATLSWTSDNNSFEVMLSTTPIDPATAGSTVSTFLANNDTTTIAGLQPNTTYYWYVRSICASDDMSSWSIEGTFTTACSPSALPFLENFESYGTGATAALSPCWRKGTNSTTAYPYPYATNPIDGTRSLYMYAYHASGTSASYYCYAALPMMAAPIDTLSLSFTTRRYNSTSAYYTTRVVVGVMSDPDDIATFTPVDTIDLYNEAPNTVKRYEVFFNNYAGDGKYIAFYDEIPPLYGANTYGYSYVYLDDVEVDYIPSCARVTNVNVNNIERHAATVRWNGDENVASYDIEYGPQGFTHGTGITVTSTTDSVVITGLNASTYYDVYVRAHCSATDVSPWSFSYNFATACGPVSLPFFYDMENFPTGSTAALPLCWNRTNNCTGSYDYYPYVYNTTYSHSGSNSLYYYLSSSSSYPSQEIMAFPEIDTLETAINAVEVNCWARVASYPGRHLILGVMTDPNDLTSFTAVDSVTLTATMTEYSMNTSSYTGHGNFIALRVDYDTTVAFSVYVDDLFIGAMSACPRVYDLTVSDGTTNSVVLGWTDTIGSSQWVVEYGQLGSETTTTIPANTNPFTLTGLTPNTNYTFRVAPICADGQQADWSRNWLNFGTALNPATVPYAYNFDNAAEWANWQTSSNNNIGWYRGNVAQHNTGYAMYLSADSGATHSWNMLIRTNAVAYRDIDFGATPGSFQLDFDAYMGGTLSTATASNNYDGIAVVIADPATYVESHDVNLTSPWGNVNDVSLLTVRRDTNWGHYTVYFDGMSGVKRLAFYHFNQATGGSYSYMNNPSAVDNLAITAQPCERPYNLAVDNATTSSVTLSWVGDDAAHYQIAYRVKGASASTNVYDTVTGTSMTIGGLPAATNYYWWVRKICTLTSADTLVSAWSVTGQFATLCAVVSVADTLFEDFESYTGVAYNSNEGTLPNCWESYNASNDIIPHITNGSTYSYCISGTNAITMTSGTSSGYTGGVDNYVRLIDIAEPTNTLTMAFWMCTESNTNGFLEVGYLTGTNYATDFVSVKHIAASAATVHSGNGLQSGHGIFDTVSFENVPAGNFPICFRWNYTSSYYSVCLDDIAVWTSVPACLEPEVTVTDTAETTLTVVWAGMAGSYEVAAVEGTWTAPANGTVVTGNTHTFTGLTPGTQYALGVRAVCGDDYYSDWTVVTATTLEHPCYTPSSIHASNVTVNSAVIDWTPGENETSWELNVTGTNYDQTFTVTTKPYTVTGLANGVTYTAKVRAICGVDRYSDWSETTTFTTTTCEGVSNVQVNNVTTNSATVIWNAPDNAETFEVNYGQSGFTQGSGTTVTATGGSHTITGLTAGMVYDVYVRTVCAEGVYSDWSTVASFETRVGIDDVDNNVISLYPNPASSTVTLTGIEGTATVTVVDMNGRETGKWTVNNGELTIDVTEMAQGAYFVRIVGDQVNAIRKLIVR